MFRAFAKITVFPLVILLAENGVAQNSNETQELIHVPSDPKSKYYLLNLEVRPNGDLEVTTRRNGLSGKSYSVRLVRCEPLLFGYIADGFDFEGRSEKVENLVRDENPRMSKLVTGSISDVISRYSCKKSISNITNKQQSTKEIPLKKPSQSLTNKELLWVEKTKQGIRKHLNGTAKSSFRNVSFHYFENKIPIVCGEVNSVDSSGRKTGFQGFIGSGDSLVFVEREFSGGEFKNTYNMLCKD